MARFSRHHRPVCLQESKPTCESVRANCRAFCNNKKRKQLNAHGCTRAQRLQQSEEVGAPRCSGRAVTSSVFSLTSLLYWFDFKIGKTNNSSGTRTISQGRRSQRKRLSKSLICISAFRFSEPPICCQHQSISLPQAAQRPTSTAAG